MSDIDPQVTEGDRLLVEVNEIVSSTRLPPAVNVVVQTGRKGDKGEQGDKGDPGEPWPVLIGTSDPPDPTGLPDGTLYFKLEG